MIHTLRLERQIGSLSKCRLGVSRLVSDTHGGELVFKCGGNVSEEISPLYRYLVLLFYLHH